MLTDVEESESGVHAQFFRELDLCAAALHKFNPDLIVTFGPDHFNGFFYELMPTFCIGSAAQGSRTGTWSPDRCACRARLRSIACAICTLHDFDVALSHEMKVDHGITIPLYKLTGALNRYNVVPIFINCAADPRPTFRRVRHFGTAVGEFFAERDRNMRITFLGSGGLSHDPPTPRLDLSPLDVARRLIKRQIPTQEELDTRESSRGARRPRSRGRQRSVSSAETSNGTAISLSVSWTAHLRISTRWPTPRLITLPVSAPTKCALG